MQEKLNAVIEERREEAEREAAERAERERKRRTAPVDCRRRFFTGRTAWPVRRCAKTRKKTLPKAPPKYQFDENGETKYWSGRGRTPKPIDEALKAGRSLDEFLIKRCFQHCW
ncbi:H-NS histone family protein [Klebsiella pneumoniae]|uniref:H-NS histone family protein n=1 Tax=Klebsiella pneumoniae TaxID=573 RepID=A0A927DNK3_KLEPN|nr:H-NS histone family protein [Klebsiella pneumoniae]